MISSYGETSGFSSVSSAELTAVNGGTVVGTEALVVAGMVLLSPVITLGKAVSSKK